MGRMFTTGKCPDCERTLTHAVIERLEVTEDRKNRQDALTLVCPHCRTIIGFTMAPETIREGVVDAFVQAVERKRKGN